MADYSFLLNYLQPKDKILLYGMGKNGNEILRFLQEIGQFEVVGAVDVRAGELSHGEISVYPPEYLNTFPDAGYDKLILTIENQEVGVDVYQKLVNTYQIRANKIISAFVYTGPFCTLSLEEFAETRSAAQFEIGRFMQNDHRWILYFRPIIESLRAQKDVSLITRLRSFVMELPMKESIVLSYILYHAERFDAALLENLLRISLKIEDPTLTDLLYGIFIDASLMPFFYKEYLFPGYYNMRRELLKKICLAYKFSSRGICYRQTNGKKIKKVCIVNDLLFWGKDAPTLVCVQIANILSDCGYDVKIVPLDPRSKLNKIPMLQPAFACNITSGEFKEYHKHMLRQQITIDYPEETFNIRKRMQGQLDKIFAYSPDLILDISDEHSVISYIYAQYFMTLYIPLRGYVSSSFFTYLAVRDEKLFAEQNEYYRYPIEAEQNLKTDLQVCIITPEPQKIYSRSDFCCNSDDFIFVTVGCRLSIELSKEFIDTICQRVLSKPHIKWFVVGEKNDYLIEIKEAFKSKIVYIPYEDDLPALYKICDAYLNPPRMGGGTSISWAMHYGLPVVMSSAPSDMSRLASVGGSIYSSFEEMANCVIALKNDPVFYEKCSLKSQEAAIKSEKNYVGALVDLISGLEQKSSIILPEI